MTKVQMGTAKTPCQWSRQSVRVVGIAWIGMGIFLWRTLDAPTKKAFWKTMVVMTGATFLMEFVYLRLDIWTFSEAIDPLIGIGIWGVPVEEFVFWFGASPLFILTYFMFSRLWPAKQKD